MIKFNNFSSVTATVAENEGLDESQLFDKITKDKDLLEKTLEARKKLQLEDAEVYRKYKMDMICITPSCTFPIERKKSAEHHYTGVVMIDMDGIADAVENIIQKIKKDRHVSMCMESLSGKGIHSLVRCDGLNDENYKEVYAIIGRYYSALARVPYDAGCCDFTRLMVLNHDPNAYYNPNAEAFDAKELIEIDNNLKLINMDNDNLSLIAYLDKAQERMPFFKGCRHTELVSLAGCMNQKGFDKEEAVEECVRRFEEPDFPASEIRGIFDSVYGLYAAQFGEKKNIKNVKSFKSLNGSLSQEEEEMIDEQDYFTRVQCEQPDISTFYNQLPDLLKERIERNVNPSIQWLQLICSITAFSGMTANTFFYAEGEKTLNLSTLVIGVSGSGKSKMDGSLDLIKMYSRYVKADFHEKVVVPAEQRLREWEDRQKQAKQDGEAPEAGEKPTVPEDKHLMSSFTTSTEGLISRVSANAPYTTFVTTNEIGEGASTGKRDYGVKNDQRCKLIEGEDVSTDYKSSGFTGVENPRYTELASGTPASVQRFLGNKEDGLTARYLYVSLPGIREYEKLKSARLGEMREKEQKLCSQVETFARMCITKYCEVVFSDRILEIIQNKIMILRKLYIPFGSDSDVSYVNRLRLKAMKICGIIAFMEAFQNNSLCGDSDENHPLPIHCSEDIATMVTSWLPYLAYTACMQTTPLRSSKASGVSFKSVKEQKFFALHPAEFTTEESERWGKMVNMSRPQSYRFRNKMVNLGVFQKIEHGKFRNTIV